MIVGRSSITRMVSGGVGVGWGLKVKTSGNSVLGFPSRPRTLARLPGVLAPDLRPTERRFDPWPTRFRA